MPLQSLILFGKHPAWADHMSLGGGGKLGGELKRQLYDRSVVAATAREVSPEDFAECIYIYQSQRQTAILTAIPSRDSIGRRQYPLFAGWVLDEQQLDGLSADFIEKICADLEVLLKSLVVASDSGQQLDQAMVEAGCATFRPGSQNKDLQPSVANTFDFGQLLRALEDGDRAFCLPAESLEASLALAECACRQFRPRAEALLVVDRAGKKHGLFLAGQNVATFPLASFFHGTLPDLRTGNWKETTKTRAALRDIENGESSVAPAFCPVLNLTNYFVRKRPSIQIRWPWVAIGSGVILISALILFFLLSSSGSDEAEDGDVSVRGHGLVAIRELWDSSSQDYVDWVKPLEGLVENTSSNYSPTREFEDLREALKSPLNPFDVFGNPVVREDRIQNPGKRIYIDENRELLKDRAENIRVLKGALSAFYESLDVHAAAEALNRKGVQARSWISGSQKQFEEGGIQLDYNEDLASTLESRIRNYQKLTGLLKHLEDFESAILSPLKEQLPEFEGYVRSTMLEGLDKGIDGGQELDNYFETLSASLKADWLLRAGGLDVDALRQSGGWAKLFNGELSLEAIKTRMAYLEDYRVIDAKRLLDLKDSTARDVSRLELKVEKANERFPGETFLSRQDGESLAAIDGVLSKWSGMAPILKNYKEMRHDSGEISRDVEVIDRRIDERIGSLTDPSRWIAERQSRIDSIRFGFLRDWVHEQLNRIREQYGMQKGSDAIKAYSAFDSNAEKLLESSSRFETKVSELIGSRFSSSLESLNPRMSDWIAERIQEVMGQEPAPEVVGKHFGRILEDFQEEARKFAREQSEVESIYNNMERAAVSAPELRERLLALKSHPFSDVRQVDKKLSSLGTGSLALQGTLDEKDLRVPDLFWLLHSAVENESVSEELLRFAARAFKKDIRDDSSLSSLKNLEEAWHSAIILLVSEQDGRSPKAAELCAHLDELIPEALQSSNHHAMKTVASFKLELMESSNAEIASDSEFFRRAKEAAAAGNAILADFWTQVGDLLANSSGNEGNSLSRILDGSALILKVEESDDRRRLSLDLGELRLQFELLEGAGKPVFLSSSPLTISQFFALYRHAGFDLEELTSPYWDRYPRTFVFIGSRRGYSDEGVWKLRPRQTFDALPYFDSDSQVMHIMQPQLAARLAGALGLRLPTKAENEELLNEHSASAPPLAALDLSRNELRESLKGETFEHSVYADQLRLAGKTASWAGGVAFDQVEQDGERFYDVSGGGAELAYQNENFYGSGSSWLLTQSSAESQQLDREKVYVDLSLRFAIDPPKLSPLERVLEWIDLSDYL